MQARTHTDRIVLFAIAGAVALVHLLTNGRYGFHRDELQFLSDARHLEWGFVAYPPFTPFVERISLELFGLSMVGLRLFSVLAQSAVIVITGLMAAELGGQRKAQFTAALSVALSPVPLFQGTEFQYSSFDLLWWVLTAYFVIRLLNTGNPRWCLAIGSTVGIGLMTKYAIAFFVAGIVLGLVFTPARRFLCSPWFWAGIGLALLICLPNLIWQARHDFISWRFLNYIHARDIRWGRAQGFVRDQFLICATPAAIALWITGLICYLRNRQFRMLAWMYLTPLVLLMVNRGRGYYMSPAYPMLIAMGGVAAERWLASLSQRWRLALEGTFFAALTITALYVCAFVLPLASGGPLKNFALSHNGDLREEIGWSELVKTVAAVRDALPPEQRRDVGVLVGNYGEQGAIELFGPAYQLPPPISMTNSAWLRGYPVPPPSRLIVLGFSRKSVDKAFTACQLAGHNGNPDVVKNEESEWHPDIFVCGSPRMDWPAFWKEYQSFG